MPGIVSEIVEVVVFRFARNAPEYLLLRRSSGETLYPGIWQIVTGTVRGGERAPEAALRELREETGLVPERFWVMPFTGSFYDQAADRVHIAPFFLGQVGETSAVRLSPEHTEWTWRKLEDALGMVVWPAQREGLQIAHSYFASGERASRFTLIRL